MRSNAVVRADPTRDIAGCERRVVELERRIVAGEIDAAEGRKLVSELTDRIAVIRGRLQIGSLNQED